MDRVEIEGSNAPAVPVKDAQRRFDATFKHRNLDLTDSFTELGELLRRK